jgi:hypothetical protein
LRPADLRVWSPGHEETREAGVSEWLGELPLREANKVSGLHVMHAKLCSVEDQAPVLQKGPIGDVYSPLIWEQWLQWLVRHRACLAGGQVLGVLLGQRTHSYAIYQKPRYLLS